MSASEIWRSGFRIAVGLFWLYFASQKWGGIAWMKLLIQASPAVNPIPGLHEFLAQVVAPNWFWFALGQSVAETGVALLLILGLASRRAAVLGFLLALNLALTVAFLDHDIGQRWLYYLAVLVNGELMFVDPGPLALERTRAAPAWLRG